MITAGLILLAAVFNVFMDWSAEGKLKGKWWNKDESSVLKYKDLTEKNYKHWYYLKLFSTNYRERFPFSTTGLVFLTDGWHLMQWCFNRCWQLAIVINLDMPHPVVVYFFVAALYGVSFEILYKSKK